MHYPPRRTYETAVIGGGVFTTSQLSWRICNSCTDHSGSGWGTELWTSLASYASS